MDPERPRLRAPTLESLFIGAFALLGWRLGLRALGDNSLFVHLRTGIDLVATHRVPTRDAYSFTAHGDRWVVQSWLAEATYGIAHRLGGFRAVRLEQGLLYGLVAWLVALLARTGVPLRTALAGLLAVGLGAVSWSPRPLVFALLCLAATVLVVERRRSPLWLIPIAWVWANSHGSFVLGLAWLALVAVGQRLDGHRRPPALVALGAFGIGLVASCVNPLGPRLLAFPVVVAQKRAAFAHVVEWRSPTFQSAKGLFALACLLGVVMVVVGVGRSGTRRWSDLLPLVAFIGAGLAAQRNLPMAAVVAAPVLARALTPSAGPAPDHRPRLHLAVGGLLAALAVLFGVVAMSQPAFDFSGYPVRASRLLPVGTRVAAPDVAAGYLILTRGQRASVLIDDRVDLYPVALTKNYVRLLNGRPGSLALLDRYGVEAVLWPDDEPLDALLAVSGRWRRAGERDGWSVYFRV